MTWLIYTSNTWRSYMPLEVSKTAHLPITIRGYACCAITCKTIPYPSCISTSSTCPTSATSWTTFYSTVIRVPAPETITRYGYPRFVPGWSKSSIWMPIHVNASKHSKKRGQKTFCHIIRGLATHKPISEQKQSLFPFGMPDGILYLYSPWRIDEHTASGH